MKKKRSFSIKLNKTKKNKNLVLLVIASIVAAVGTAVFGILKRKGKKNVQDESQDSATPEVSSASNETVVPKPKPPARFAHRKLQPGELDWEQLAKEKEVEQIRRGEIPDYMLADVEKPQRGIKRRKWKIALSGVATLLAVAVVSSNIAQYLRPSEAMAKESFSGIGKIVAEHDEEPYKILNIVPVRAKWLMSEPNDDTVSGDDTDDGTDDNDSNDNISDDNSPDDDISNDDSLNENVRNSFTFSMGTMDYLAGGKILSAELEAALKGNPMFSHYAIREDLINKLIPESSTNAFPWIKYEEAYGGIHNVSEVDGWTLLFNNQEVPKEDDGTYDLTDKAKMSEGIFYGTWKAYKEGDSKVGYDFISYNGKTKTGLNASNLSKKFVYIYAEATEDEPEHWFPVTLAVYYEKFLPDNIPAYMPDPDKARMVTISEDGPNCAPEDYVYEFDGEVYNPLKTAVKIDDWYNRIVTTSPEISEQQPTQEVQTPAETVDLPEGGSDIPEGGNEETSEEEAEIETDDDVLLDSKNTVTAYNWRRLVEDDQDSDAGNSDTTQEPAEPIPDPGSVDPEDPEEPIPDPDPVDPAEPIPDPDPVDPEEPIPDPDPVDPAEPIPDPNPVDPAEPIPDPDPVDPVEPTPKPDPDQPPASSEDDDMSEKEFFKETTCYILDWNSFDRITDEELEAMFADAGSEDSVLEDENGIMLLVESQNPDDENKFIYVGSGQGDYRLTETGNKDDKIIGVYNAPVYYRCQAGNDWLRKYVFNSLEGGDNASNSFQIEVTTVRADEVTEVMVDNADLIYMESGQKMFLGPSLVVEYIQHVDDPIYGEVNDMSTDVVRAILRHATEDLMPIIVDYDITQETDTDKYAGTNYQLLAKSLLKRDLEGFYEAMNDGINLIDNLRMYLDNKAGDSDKKEYPDKYDNNYNYVNQNVYVVNDEYGLVWEDFYTYFDGDTAKAGFNDVLTAIEAENTTLAEEDRISLAVSKAMAIQYIINFSVGIMGEFDDLTILELQPTANIDAETGVSYDLCRVVGSDESTKLVWRPDASKPGKQILYSKKQFDVSIDLKSVAEFNGEWEDINGTYDMIFIGLDGRNLNLGDKQPRRAVYNNEELNGQVYHQGDESGSGTYDSNDITAQKMDDLLEYLKAGYPIVVENDFFTDGTARGASEETINKDYIAYGTAMYYFIKEAVSSEEYNGSIFTVSDTMSNAGFMARIKTAKPRIELADEDSEPDQGSSMVQRLTLDENDEYHGRIAYQIKNNRGEDYYGGTVIHLYADLNYDGIFGEEEELGEEFGAYTNEGNVIDVAVNGMGPGVIPWKLEVTDNGNPYRRSSVQGYFELLSANEEQIRVLQVTKSQGDPAIDLEEMYKNKDDSVLGGLLRNTRNLAFELKSLTPAELGKCLTDNPKYLNQWDIVVLTVDDGVTVDSAAFKDYIGEGRSLLICSQNKGSNLAGLDIVSTEDQEGVNIISALGLTPGLKKTYVSLGMEAGERYHRYSGLNSSKYAPGRAGMRADKINEGSIFYYPYEMAGSSLSFVDKMAENGTGLRASEYLLDFENNLKSENRDTKEAYVTTWLTFGGNTDTAYYISPKDARNNYYCYSKGNVVYLAQSEYPYIYEEGETELTAMGIDECKFFVNALMAAYGAGVHGSEVSVVSGFARTSAPVKSISVPFDQEWLLTADDNTQGILDETVDVYFKFADSNIGANKKVTVSFYYEAPDGEQEFIVGDTIVKAKPFGSDIWTVTDNKLVQVTPGDPQNSDEIGLIPGKVYRIKAPVISLRTLTDETTNDAGIFVLVKSEFYRNGKKYETEGFATVSLNRAKLFLLE